MKTQTVLAAVTLSFALAFVAGCSPAAPDAFEGPNDKDPGSSDSESKSTDSKKKSTTTNADAGGASCNAQNVTWTAGASQCSAPLGEALAPGATRVVTDSADAITGQVTVTCSNGALALSGASCAATNTTNTCMAATDLGSVSGDTGADTKSAQGNASQWFTVRVTEDDGSFAGVDLWMTATLVSPPGTNFDLFVYVPDNDSRECSSVSNQSTSTSDTDTTTAKFGENGVFANGDSDSRTVTIEVRHISGAADPSQKWTLNIEGNK